MIRTIRSGLRGHPGTPFLLYFAVLGWFAARHWLGAAVMLVFVGPLYLWGAYERGKLLRATENPNEREGHNG